MRILILLLIGLGLAACDVVFGPEPTATPTPYPEVLPSPVPDIRFPTEIPNDIPMGDGITIPQAAGLPAHAGLATEAALPELARPALITVTLRDGRALNGEAYAGQAGRPGVLLLGASFEVWGGVPVLLRDLGYTVLTVEGGISLDAQALPAMLDTLAVQPDIDATRLFVMGVQEGANTALTGCAADSRCVGAIVISPVADASLTIAAQAMGPRPILLTASREDSDSFTAIESAAQAARNALIQPFEGAGRGVQILTNRPDFIRLIGEFLAR